MTGALLYARHLGSTGEPAFGNYHASTRSQRTPSLSGDGEGAGECAAREWGGRSGSSAGRRSIVSSNRPIATTRRGLLNASAATLAALGLHGIARPGSAVPTASAQAAGPWLGGNIPPAVRTSRQMAAAAGAFLDGLS